MAYGSGDYIHEMRESYKEMKALAERMLGDLRTVRDLLPHGKQREAVTEEIAALERRMETI
jgi:hypothetical protein